jgi:hypothetical protein
MDRWEYKVVYGRADKMESELLATILAYGGLALIVIGFIVGVVGVFRK